MKRKNVIVVISEEVEVFGNFKKMCEAKGFPYHSLKMKPFPITHENVVIHRVPFKQRLTAKALQYVAENTLRISHTSQRQCYMMWQI